MTGLLMDANLLCLLVAGLADRDAIGRHRRLRGYNVADYDLVVSVLRRFRSVIVRPHVLTETSNLLRYTNDALALQLQTVLADVTSQFSECFEPATSVTSDQAFGRLGLTDAMLLLLAACELTLFSDDRDLCQAAADRALRVINFNYLRDGAVRLDQL